MLKSINIILSIEAIFNHSDVIVIIIITENELINNKTWYDFCANVAYKPIAGVTNKVTIVATCLSITK